MRKIRILIVEDSPSVATLLRAVFASEPDMEVVGQACDGCQALALAESLAPDLITMDIQMPVMDGVTATAKIMERRPTPIVVVTSSTGDEELRSGFRALEAGAVSVIEKPAGIASGNLDTIRARLLSTVRAMVEVKLVRRSSGAGHGEMPVPGAPASRPEIVAVGASTGGPQALQSIVSVLAEDYPLPIVVVQHMSPGFVVGLARWLDGRTGLRVKLAENGEPLLPGTVYLADDDRHLLVRRRQRRLLVHLDRGPPWNGFRPSVTPLLRSVAWSCAGKAVGVMLTGMGDDGAEGMLAMRDAGCETVAQDRASSVVFGMPGAAIDAGGVSHVLALGRIGAYLEGVVARRRQSTGTTGKELWNESTGG